MGLFDGDSVMRFKNGPPIFGDNNVATTGTVERGDLDFIMVNIKDGTPEEQIEHHYCQLFDRCRNSNVKGTGIMCDFSAQSVGLISYGGVFDEDTVSWLENEEIVRLALSQTEYLTFRKGMLHRT